MRFKKYNKYLIIFGIVLLSFGIAYANGVLGGGSSGGVAQIERGEVVAFTNTGTHTWTVPEGVHYVDVLVVAGGGGAGSHEFYSGTATGTGGGGAGGLIFESGYEVTPGEETTITVGEGGLSGGGTTSSGGVGGQGGTSSAFTLTAIGGGGGAWRNGEATSGGSGGGAGYTYNTGADGTANQGNKGGNTEKTSPYYGGGGGGAGEIGENGYDEGKGGDGLYFGDVFGEGYGEDGWFAGGGQGGKTESSGGLGGGGGAGNPAEDGTPNTGGGGGGSGGDGQVSGDGGSGIVLIRYGAKTQASSTQSGLVGHWTLDENDYNSNTNRVTDKSAYENHGTNNGATFTTDRKEQSNSAMNFDGGDLNDGIKITEYNPFDEVSELTISAWVNPEHVGDFGPIAAKNYKEFQLKIHSNGQFQVSLWPNGIRENIYGGTAPKDKWSHVLFTWDGETGEVLNYIDGELAYSGFTDSGVITLTTASLYLGGYAGDRGSYLYGGLIDDVRVYNRALSEEEIKSLYESYNPKLSAGSLKKGLVLDMPLRSPYTKDETVGSEIMTDRTPYSNDGQNYGATITNDGADFDGNDDYIEIGNVGNLTEVTVSLWFESDSVSNYKNLFSLLGLTAITAWILQQYSTGELSWFYGLGGSYVSTNIESNTLYNIVVQQTVDGLYIYKNGILVDSDLALGQSTSLSTNVHIGVGFDNGAARYFDGNITGFKIWNRALSPAEVKLLYEKGRS